MLQAVIEEQPQPQAVIEEHQAVAEEAVADEPVVWAVVGHAPLCQDELHMFCCDCSPCLGNSWSTWGVVYL